MTDTLGPYQLGPNDTPENGIYTGDAWELAKAIPDKCVDFILTDPPYPDYYEQFGYKPGMLDFLLGFECRQFVFWSSKVPFPLDYTAIHIWDKKTGAASQYERIFERNGGNGYRVYRHYLINSPVAASYTRDIYTGYPSQKPAALIREILGNETSPGDIVADFFAGSGTIPAMCKAMGRVFLSCDINPVAVGMARDRVRNTQPPLPLVYPEQMEMKI